ncbi:MAG: alpha/beta fold hydrolase [Elusimicrobia bacterium]|nr:alpha/beta fold hydrolase [Elusimicrobiota bacterium]
MKRFLWTAALAFWGWTLRGAEPFDVAVEGPTRGDPLILQGNFTAPASSGAPVLVMIHGVGSTRAEWAPLVRQAAGRGWGALAFDLRGHGRSRATLAGKTVDYEEPRNGRNPAFWETFPGDLEQVIAALEKKTGVAQGQIVLVGASLGANVALDVAARVKGFRALVLLSPGLEYAGINAEGPMAALATPTLLIAAEPDLYAFTSGERLRTLAPPDLLTWKPLVMGTPQGAHGTQLFDGHLEGKILDWIARPPVKKAAPKKSPAKVKRCRFLVF